MKIRKIELLDVKHNLKALPIFIYPHVRKGRPSTKLHWLMELKLFPSPHFSMLHSLDFKVTLSDYLWHWRGSWMEKSAENRAWEGDRVLLPLLTCSNFIIKLICTVPLEGWADGCVHEYMWVLLLCLALLLKCNCTLWEVLSLFFQTFYKIDCSHSQFLKFQEEMGPLCSCTEELFFFPAKPLLPPLSCFY